MQFELGPLTIRPLHIVLAALGISLLLVLVIIAMNPRAESTDTLDVPLGAELHPWATADRLVVPEDFSLLELQWVPYRGRRSEWTPEQVAEYWNDPRQIGLEVLERRLEAEIRSLLEDASQR